MQAVLRVLKGKGAGQLFTLPKNGRVNIGRGHGCHLQLLDEGLSRNHCVVEGIENAFKILDLNSKNGTFVNGNKVTMAFLNPDDVIRIGEVEIQFVTRQETDSFSAVYTPSAPGEKTENVIRDSLRGPGPPSSPSPLAAPSTDSIREGFLTIHRDLATIYRIGNIINSESDTKKVAETILEAVTNRIDVDHGAVFVLNDKIQDLKPVCVRSKAPRSAGALPLYSQRALHLSYKSGVSIYLPDLRTDPRFRDEEAARKAQVYSVLCVPLKTGERVHGMVYCDTRGRLANLKDHQVEFVNILASQAGVAVDKARLMEENERLFVCAIRALVGAIELRDEYTRGHSERVTEFSLEIAETMGWTGGELKTMRLSGLLHDIGKIGVSDKTLKKAGPLTKEEWEEIKMHPVLGAQLLKTFEGMDEIILGVRHHHERFDGNGYPDRLKGTGIPLIARMMCVADSFDAMTSSRPYRPGLHKKVAFGELRKNAGVQFDPDCVDAFLKRYEAPEEAGSPNETMVLDLSKVERPPS